MRVKQQTFQCSLGEPALTIWAIQDLPDGVACYWAVEDERRPRGEAYVVKKRGGKKTTRRFKTSAEAIAHAKEWAAAAMKKGVAR